MLSSGAWSLSATQELLDPRAPRSPIPVVPLGGRPPDVGRLPRVTLSASVTPGDLVRGCAADGAVVSPGVQHKPAVGLVQARLVHVIGPLADPQVCRHHLPFGWRRLRNSSAPERAPYWDRRADERHGSQVSHGRPRSISTWVAGRPWVSSSKWKHSPLVWRIGCTGSTFLRTQYRIGSVVIVPPRSTDRTLAFELRPGRRPRTSGPRS
jgi:hypothetical protein